MRREEGSALIAAILISVVLAIIAGTVLKTADHSNQSTTLDRLRVQSVQAAEAGINAAMKRLETVTTCDPTATAPANLSDGPSTIASYRTRVDPESGAVCSGDNRVIRSWGYAPTLSGRSMRQVEVTVKLIPHRGFNFALFAEGAAGIVYVKNTGTVQGDVYAENLDQSKNNIDAESVITPGSIDTKNDAVYAGTLWAGGNVTLRQNGQVAGSIIAAGVSAPGNVIIENGVKVTRDVKARGSISLPTTYTVGGSVSANNPSVVAPPQLTKPSFTWDPANYTPAPTTFVSGVIASTWLSANSNNLQGTLYIPDPAGVVDLSNGGTVTGPLTIVTSGKVLLGSTLAAGSGQWPVSIISTNSQDDAISMTKPTTLASGLDVLLFTGTGGVDVQNNTTMTGVIYADRITIKNSFIIKRSQFMSTFTPANFDWSAVAATNYTVVPLVWREVAPVAP